MQETKLLSNVLEAVLKKADMSIHEIALLYYEIYDIVSGTNHNKIFRVVYGNKKYRYLDEVSRLFGIDSKTLYNYRKQYQALLEEIRNILQNIK